MLVVQEKESFAMPFSFAHSTPLMFSIRLPPVSDERTQHVKGLKSTHIGSVHPPLVASAIVLSCLFETVQVLCSVLGKEVGEQGDNGHFG